MNELQTTVARPRSRRATLRTQNPGVSQAPETRGDHPGGEKDRPGTAARCVAWLSPRTSMRINGAAKRWGWYQGIGLERHPALMMKGPGQTTSNQFTMRQTLTPHASGSRPCHELKAAACRGLEPASQPERCSSANGAGKHKASRQNPSNEAPRLPRVKKQDVRRRADITRLDSVANVRSGRQRPELLDAKRRRPLRTSDDTHDCGASAR